MNPEASKVKRCLFGRPDHQELEADLQKELSKDMQEMNEKWNFDFQKGKPLKGKKFEWEPVQAPKEESQGAASSAEIGHKEIKKKSAEQHTKDCETPVKNRP